MTEHLQQLSDDEKGHIDESLREIWKGLNRCYNTYRLEGIEGYFVEDLGNFVKEVLDCFDPSYDTIGQSRPGHPLDPLRRRLIELYEGKRQEEDELQLFSMRVPAHTYIEVEVKARDIEDAYDKIFNQSFEVKPEWLQVWLDRDELFFEQIYGFEEAVQVYGLGVSCA